MLVACNTGPPTGQENRVGAQSAPISAYKAPETCDGCTCPLLQGMKAMAAQPARNQPKAAAKTHELKPPRQHDS